MNILLCSECFVGQVWVGRQRPISLSTNWLEFLLRPTRSGICVSGAASVAAGHWFVSIIRCLPGNLTDDVYVRSSRNVLNQ